jgi:hypothetical protein
MSNSPFIDFVLRLLALLSGGAIVLIAVMRWSGERLAKRLEQSWQHQYDRQLEAVRDQLAQNRALVAVASQTVQSAYLGAHERRASAAAELWKGVLEGRRQDLSPLEVIDLIPAAGLQKSRLTDLFPAKTVTEAARRLVEHSAIDRQVEVHRPFLSPRSWVLFRALRAFQSQMYVALISSYEKDTNVKPVRDIFHEPNGPRQILVGVLDQQELDRIDRLPILIVQNVRETLEQKILAAIAEHLTGAEGSQLAFDEATRLLQAISASERTAIPPK